MKAKEGDLIEVEFLDHSSGTEPYPFKVWGRLVKVCKKYIYVVCWDHVDTSKVDYNTDNNIEGYSILKSCIKKIKRLKYRE